MSFFDFRKREKRQAAAALTYDPVKPEPPQVVAIGRGHMAEEILRVAKQNGIPLHEDPGLVEALAMLDVSDYIPRELYAVIAEILSYVFRVDTAAQSRYRS